MSALPPITDIGGRHWHGNGGFPHVRGRIGIYLRRRRGTMKSLWSGAFAMPLQRGEVQGYDFNRSVVEFTMLNQGKIILCAISTAAMDDLEGRRAEEHTSELQSLRHL